MAVYQCDGRVPELAPRGGGLECLLRLPEGDVDEAEVRAWREAAVESRPDVPLLGAEERARTLPAREVVMPGARFERDPAQSSIVGSLHRCTAWTQLSPQMVKNGLPEGSAKMAVAGKTQIRGQGG